MHKLPKRFIDRIAPNLRKYQKIAESQRTADVAEADTVTLVKDILADIFGYDKYTELTSEFQIRGTYCDLAVKIDNKIKLLIEVKSAGTDLSNNHMKQAVDYGAHKGILWVILTNGIEWRYVKINLAGQINFETATKFNLLEINPRKEEDLQTMFLLSREGVQINAMDAFHINSQLINRYTISEIVRSEAVVNVIRREMRRLFPEAKVGPDVISDFLVNEVVRRETMEGEKSKDAQDRIKKAEKKLTRNSVKAATSPKVVTETDES